MLFRRLLGDVLRAQRMRRGLTLREVSAEARVSLGYISEIERGQKEASSELLASLCGALDVPLSDVLREVSDAVALEEAALALEVASIEVGSLEVAGDVPGRGRRLRRLTADLTRPIGRSARSCSSGWQRGHQYVARSRPAGPCMATATGVPQRRHGDRSRR